MHTLAVHHASFLPGRVMMYSYAEVCEVCPITAGTYISLDFRCVAPGPLARCSCNNTQNHRRAVACSDPAALGVHLKPLPPMNRSGPELLTNAAIVGYDAARAALTGSPVHLNCQAGQHRTGATSISTHWYLGRSTADGVLAKILLKKPS